MVTGRYYIGMHSTSNLEDGYLGSGKRLRYSIRKYGKENHKIEILEFFDTRELLVEAEKKKITLEILGDIMCMNLMSGGTGGFVSEEQQRYRSQCAIKQRLEKAKLDPNWLTQYKKIQSIAQKKSYQTGRKKIVPNWNGKKHSNETKLKISNTKKGQGLGELNSQYGTCWITKDGINKKIKKEDLLVYEAEGWIKGRK